MDDVIINATGTDLVKLWYIRNRKISFRRFQNRSWIFVSGSDYDLDFLSRQLDCTDLYDYSEYTGKNVYGEVKGLKIYVKPSGISDLILAVENIGMGRKFSIYNADVNPILRFMSERDLEFFSIESPYHHDPPMDSVYIGGRSHLGSPSEIRIGDRVYGKVNSLSLSDVADAIMDNVFIIYDNKDRFFEKILRMITYRGYTIPAIRGITGSTYESYGQIYYNNPRIAISGRIAIEAGSFAYSECGLPGLVEISRMSSLPITTASSVTTGTAVSSMEESHAIKNSILIPLYKDDHEQEKSSLTLTETDKGGMVLQPDPGLYQDVYEIDFSSMYPSIIVNYNLSPETITGDGDFEVPGTPYRITNRKQGFLSDALRHLLEKRLFYKSIKHMDTVYGNRDAALKWMLLTSFGYTGYKNAKFGKIEVHEAITSLGRWALTMAINIARDHGFEAIHGIVDSLWIRGTGNIDRVLEAIERKTRIGIVVDGHYRWIAFMPARSGLGALNRYIGLRDDGMFKVRGIELRRRDVPGICIKFQTEALDILRKCNTTAEIWARRKEIKDLENLYMKSLRKMPREDFRMGVHVTRRFDEYRVNNLQKKLLEASGRAGYEINAGDTVDAVVVSRKGGIIDPGDQYDEVDLEFYRKFLLRAFEPIDFIVSSSSAGTEPVTLSAFYS